MWVFFLVFLILWRPFIHVLLTQVSKKGERERGETHHAYHTCITHATMCECCYCCCSFSTIWSVLQHNCRNCIVGGLFGRYIPYCSSHTILYHSCVRTTLILRNLPFGTKIPYYHLVSAISSHRSRSSSRTSKSRISSKRSNTTTTTITVRRRR